MRKHLIQTEDQLNGVYDEVIRPANRLSLDTETTGLHHIRDRVVGWSFGNGADFFYAPILHTIGSIPGDPTEIGRRFFQRLKDDKIPLIMHNALFDTSLIYRSFGVYLKMFENVIHDTMAMAYVCGEERHGLKPLTYKYFMHKMTEFKALMEQHFGKNWKRQKKSFMDLTSQQALDYACEDAIYTYMLLEPLLKQLGELQCEGVYKMEMACTPVVTKLNFTGVKIDVPMLAEAARLFEQQNNERQKAIDNLAGRPIKINSPPEVAKLFFHELGLPVKKRSRTTGKPSTDAETMRALKDMHPIVPLIAAWRIAKKLHSAYAVKIPNSVESNGRIYPLFTSIGTVSGRFKSASAQAHDGVKYGINFQNVALNTFESSHMVPWIVPQEVKGLDTNAGIFSDELEAMNCKLAKADDPQAVLIRVLYDTDVRRAFIPVEGHDWLKADFSQVEFRIMASLAGEDVLIDGFNRGVDYHTLTASIMLRKPLDTITKEERAIGKMLNFGLAYGMSPYTLALRTGMSEAEAQQKYEYYFSQVPKLAQFIASCKEFARNYGYVKTFFGRMRYLPIDNLPPRKVDAYLRRAFNTVIQGTAADILKIAMIRTFDAIEGMEGVKGLLTVHDELDFEIRRDIYDDVAAKIKYAMEVPVPDGWAKIAVDLERGATWSGKDLQEFTPTTIIQPEKFTDWNSVVDWSKYANSNAA
jgi:DNA polymerase-1